MKIEKFLFWFNIAVMFGVSAYKELNGEPVPSPNSVMVATEFILLYYILKNEFDKRWS